MIKRITAVLTVLCVLASLASQMPVFAASVEMCPVTLLGDADNDGFVTENDIKKLQSYITKTNEEISINADINGDRIINVIDLFLLKQYISGTFTPKDYTKLVINEVCSTNKKCLIDNSENAPDWVEIYNPTDQDISLAGFGLSDGKKNLFKFTFPDDAVIFAGGYVIVLCDDAVNQSEDEYHAAFKISADGESIYFTHPKMGTIDAVDVPALETDTTYGRYDGELSVLIPTPGAENEKKNTAPVFSHESGFYNESFMLELSCDADSAIFYTTDGSDPLNSETAMKYDNEVLIYDNTSDENIISSVTDISTTNIYTSPDYQIDKGMIIRAASVAPDGSVSDIITKTYFIGKNQSYYNNIKVISLVTDPDNLFDYETGIYVSGSKYYDWKNSEDYDENINAPSNYNSTGREWERPCTVQLFENCSLAYEDNMGIRIHGGFTRNYFQKSFRLYARSEYGSSKINYPIFDNLTDIYGNEIISFDKLILRNGGNDYRRTKIRDDLIQSLVTDRAVSTQAGDYAIVFLDGEFHGLYTIKERYDEDYIESHYGVDKNNITTIKNGTIEGDNEIGNSYKEFYNWAISADMTDEKNYQKVCATIDIQSFIDYIAIESYINNTDFSNVLYANNWEMWRVNTTEEGNFYGDGKWRFMLFDTDTSSNLKSTTTASQNIFESMYKKKTWKNLTSLFYHLLDSDIFCQQFAESYKEIVNVNFDPERVNKKISEFVSLTKKYTQDTNDRFFGIGNEYSANYDNYIQNLRNFYYERPEYALRYLNELLGIEDDLSEIEDELSEPNNELFEYEKLITN